MQLHDIIRQIIHEEFARNTGGRNFNARIAPGSDYEFADEGDDLDVVLDTHTNALADLENEEEQSEEITGQSWSPTRKRRALAHELQGPVPPSSVNTHQVKLDPYSRGWPQRRYM